MITVRLGTKTKNPYILALARADLCFCPRS